MNKSAWKLITVPIIGSICILFFCHPSVEATDTDYYVDCDAGDDSAAGTSEAEAWESLDNISDGDFEAGDTIYFKSGCEFTGYPYEWSPAVYISSSGVEGNPITYTSYGVGDKPLFSNPPSDTNSVGFSIEAAWIVIDGLAITDVHNHGIWIGAGGHVTVQNCEIYDVGLGITLTSGNHTIANNYIHDLNMIVNTPTDPEIPGSDDNDTGATGIVVGGDNNEIYGNTFRNCKAPSYDYTYDGGAVEFYGTYMSNNNIHHNISITTQGFTEIGSETDGTCSNNIIAYNRIYDSGTLLSVHNGGDSFAATVSDITIENNTVYDTDGYYMMTFSQDSLSSENWSIKNNIFVGFQTVASRFGYVSENNIYYNFTDIPTLGTNDLYVDPDFVDAASQDFTLNLESPAVDSGSSSVDNAYDYDLLNNTVPSGDGVDRGCYELQQAAPATTTTTTTSSTSTTTTTASSNSTTSTTTEGSSTTVTTIIALGSGTTLPSDSSSSTLPATGLSSINWEISAILILLAALILIV